MISGRLKGRPECCLHDYRAEPIQERGERPI